MTTRDMLVLLGQIIIPTAVLYAASFVCVERPMSTAQILLWWPCTLLVYGSMVAVAGFITVVRKKAFKHVMGGPWTRTILATLGGMVSGYFIVGPTLMVVASVCTGTTILVSCETPTEIL